MPHHLDTRHDRGVLTRRGSTTRLIFRPDPAPAELGRWMLVNLDGTAVRIEPGDHLEIDILGPTRRIVIDLRVPETNPRTPLEALPGFAHIGQTPGDVEAAPPASVVETAPVQTIGRDVPSVLERVGAALRGLWR